MYASHTSRLDNSPKVLLFMEGVFELFDNSASNPAPAVANHFDTSFASQTSGILYPLISPKTEQKYKISGPISAIFYKSYLI